MTDRKQFLGKLRALGDRLENVTTNVAKVGATGLDTIVTGVQQVGTGALALAKDIKDSVLDGELDRLRGVHEFQKRQAAESFSRRKQYTDKELTAADQKADAVLQRLPPGYYDKDYDPVRHELSQLTDTSGQEDIDAIVERLGTYVEAVSGKLSRHVMKKRDKLIQGINVVATVEDDLKTALAMTRSGRGTVRRAGDEVQRQLRVAGQTRRKQAYMQLMEVLVKIKQAKDLQKMLRKAQESGEYHAAIILCVQCFQNVNSLKDLEVSDELLSTVQRLYVDTLHKLDVALTAICADFDPVRYTKVLDAYLVQGTGGQALAERVLQSVRDAINDTTLRGVRALLLTQPQLVSRLSGVGSSATLEGSFQGLCAALPPTLLLPGLTQVMEVVLASLGSYHNMARWHDTFLAANRTSNAEGEDAKSATIDILAAVSETLNMSRVEIFSHAVKRVVTLVKLPAATTAANMLQVAEHCHRFLSVGEAFCGCELPTLRDMFGGVLSTSFEAYHHANMQTLSTLMQGEEAWKNVGGPRMAHEIQEGCLLHLATVVQPPTSMAGNAPDPLDFGAVIKGGSPFKPLAPISIALCPPLLSSSARQTLGPTIPTSAASHVQQEHHHLPQRHYDAAGNSQSATPSSSHPPAAQLHAGAPGQGHGLRVNTSATPSSPGATSSSQQYVPGTSSSQQQNPLQQQQQSGGGSTSTSGAAPISSSMPMMTAAARHMLTCIKAYSQLYRALGRARCGTIWQATTELVDRFLAATFVLLSGISVESLVFRDDLMTTRLQRALLRILSADGSRYKAHIEELQRIKAVQSGQRSSFQATGISWLDRFGDRMESLAHDLDKSVSKLSAAIGDKVLDATALALNTSMGTSLQERVVAGESLALVGAEIRSGRAAVMSILHAASAAIQSGAIRPVPQSPAGMSLVGTPTSPLRPGTPSRFPPSPAPTTSSAAPGEAVDEFGFKVVAPPPPTKGVKLSYAGMQSVVAYQQHQQQQQQSMSQQQQPPSLATTSTSGARQYTQSSSGYSVQGGAETSASNGQQYYAGMPVMAVTTASTAREADAYFSRVVESTFDLREGLLQGAARVLLGRLLDPERGLAASIAAVPSYLTKESPVRHNSWADGVAASLRGFAAALEARTDLPQMVHDQLWISALGLICDALTNGFARVKKCTMEGRAAMSMDLAAVERVVRLSAPASAAPVALLALKKPDEYVRAMYLPWDELSRFCQLRCAEYGMPRLAPLIEQYCELHRVSRKEKAHLLDLVMAISAD